MAKNKFYETPEFDTLTADHGNPIENKQPTTTDTPEFTYKIAAEFDALKNQLTENDTK